MSEESERERVEHVRSLVAELHQTLGETGPLDPALEGPLREALKDVSEALDRTREADSSDSANVAERVESLALEFELAHPTLAGLITRLTNQLASLGI